MTNTSTSEGRAARIVASVLGTILAAGGISKLLGEPHQVAHFAAWGLPHWFLLLVGTFEILGGTLLVVPQTTPVGSLVLGTIMVGALWTHVSHAEWPDTLPVLVVLALLAFVFRRSQARVIRLLGGVGAPLAAPGGTR